MIQKAIRSPLVQSAIRRADRIVLPGFGGSSLYRTGQFFASQMRNIRLGERSAAATYSFLLAIPPSMLFFASLVPYLPLKGLEESILSTLRIITPNQSSYESVSGVVLSFLHDERRDILSFGVLLTLFFSSNGMMGLMRTFDRSSSAYRHRTGLKRRWVAIKLTLLLLLAVIISLGLIILQTAYVNGFLFRLFGVVWAIKAFSFLLLGTIIFTVISVIYTYGPSLTHRFPFVSPGSVAATFLSMTVSAVFFFLVNHVLHYDQVYGSIGTLIAFMVWTWLNILILLIGYELNVSILLGRIHQTHEQATKHA